LPMRSASSKNCHACVSLCLIAVQPQHWVVSHQRFCVTG
jgi:hypothetical protein